MCEKSDRARLALLTKQTEAGAARGVRMLNSAPDSTAHGVAVFSNSMSGRQVIHTLFHFQDRTPGQAQREAMAGISSL
eukprot:7437503-Alexandrium_andersonii.AAC.1